MYFGDTNIHGVTGEYGFYGQYVYPEEYLPANEDYLDEQWAQIEEDCDYWVSTHGRIWSSKSMRFIKPKRLDREGHVGLSIYRRGGQKPLYRYIHRLMADCFLPDRENKTVVRHLDDIPTNNYIENLAWGTQKDNIHDCIENGKAYSFTEKDRRKGLLKVMTPVIATNLDTGEEKRYESLEAAVRATGVQQSNAWKVIHGRRKHAGGYSFRKAE